MKQLFSLLLVVIFLTPFVGFAAESASGLVPCGNPGQASCQTCHLYQLVENVADWFFGVASMIATILIIYGGFRLSTSTGNVEAKKNSRKLVFTAIGGFILILSAWYLVTLLIAVLSGVSADDASIWSSLECVAQPGE